MRVPELAPSLEKIFVQIPVERMEAVIQQINPLPAGKYLHWDELRRHPVPDGLTYSEWWAAVKLARTSSFQSLPLLDKQGQLFVFATPSPLVIDLHHIDRDAAGQIRAAGAPLQADSQRYLINSLIEEAITSSPHAMICLHSKQWVCWKRPGRAMRSCSTPRRICVNGWIVFRGPIHEHAVYFKDSCA